MDNNTTMRHWMRLCESDANIPRLWLGPAGEAINLDDEDDYTSHSAYVLRNLGLFGLPDTFNQQDEDEEIDYDVVIAKAEADGWIRISRDTSLKGGVAISASSVRNVLRGVRWLQDQGFAIHALAAEIEIVLGAKIHQRYYHLTDDALERFLKYGVMPRR